MNEQIIIGIRGSKGERVEVIDFKDFRSIGDDTVKYGTSPLNQALERAHERYKRMK